MTNFYLTLRFEDNSPLRNQDILIRSREGDSFFRTDEKGRLKFSLDSEEISVFVENQSIKEDWYIGGKNDVEEFLYIPERVERELLKSIGTRMLLTLRYENGEPVSKEKAVFRYGGRGKSFFETETDLDGRLDFYLRADEIKRFEVGGKLIREDWYIGDGEVEEFFSIPHPQSEYDPEQEDRLVKSVVGRLYYFDGTQPFKEIQVEVEVPGGVGMGEVRYPAENNGFSREDGSFYVELPNEIRPEHMFELTYWIAGQKIDPKRIHYANNWAVIILPDINFIGRGGQDGGVITGKVVDSGGEGIAGAKVEATVDKTGLLGNAFNTDVIEAKTTRSGRFALGFSGGTAIRKITVNGDTPPRIYKRRRDPETGEQVEVDIAGDSLKAGSFNILLEKPKKLFGIF